MTYNRVYSDKLDRRKNWYAYNSSICGYQRTNEQNVARKYLSSDLKQINIGDVRDGNGSRVSHFIFGRKRSEQVYAISSFGVLALGLRQRKINNDVFSSEAFKQKISTVNAVRVPLEQFGANSVNQCYGSTGAVSSKLSTRITKQKGYIRHNLTYSMY